MINNIKDNINNYTNIFNWYKGLCITGEEYVNKIKEKPNNEKTWYDKLYIWYYHNIIYIILSLGILLIICMFYNLSKKNKKIHKTINNNVNIQNGGSSLGKRLKGVSQKTVSRIRSGANPFYVLVFSYAIILGFGFFFLPTICMIVIGLLTYQLAKKQISNLFTI